MSNAQYGAWWGLLGWAFYRPFSFVVADAANVDEPLHWGLRLVFAFLYSVQSRL